MIFDTTEKVMPFFALFMLFTFVCGEMNYVLGVNLEQGNFEALESGEEDENIYAGTGSMSHFIFSYRNSLGDYDLEHFNSLYEHPAVYWACWATWYLVTFLNVMVFLNFLIAVISEQYTEVMANKLEQEYQKRTELLA
jgi:hypothetical protein